MILFVTIFICRDVAIISSLKTSPVLIFQYCLIDFARNEMDKFRMSSLLDPLGLHQTPLESKIFWSLAFNPNPNPNISTHLLTPHSLCRTQNKALRPLVDRNLNIQISYVFGSNDNHTPLFNLLIQLIKKSIRPSKLFLLQIKMISMEPKK